MHNAADFYAARGQVDDKEHVVANESMQGKDFHCEEVAGCYCSLMRRERIIKGSSVRLSKMLQRITLLLLLLSACGSESDPVATDAAIVFDAAPSPCSDNVECTACVYPLLVQSTEQCDCQGCESFPASVEECADRESAYASVCTANGLPRMCAPVDCTAPPTVECVAMFCEVVSN